MRMVSSVEWRKQKRKIQHDKVENKKERNLNPLWLNFQIEKFSKDKEKTIFRKIPYDESFYSIKQLRKTRVMSN